MHPFRSHRVQGQRPQLVTLARNAQVFDAAPLCRSATMNSAISSRGSPWYSSTARIADREGFERLGIWGIEQHLGLMIAQRGGLAFITLDPRAFYPLLCSLEVGGSTIPLGPAIPQSASPIKGKTKIKVVHPSFVPEAFVDRQTLAIAQRSTNRMITATTIKKMVSICLILDAIAVIWRERLPDRQYLAAQCHCGRGSESPCGNPPAFYRKSCSLRRPAPETSGE